MTSIQHSTMASASNTSAKLTFYVRVPDGVKAFQTINADPKTGERHRNFEREEKEVPIENARGEEAITLDKAGFQLVKRAAKHTAFVDDAEIRREYYPESADLIKQITGASKVVWFDHTIRRRRPGEIDDSPDKRQPVSLTHVDQTTKSSIARVHRHLPADEAPDLLKRRFQIINLWRPISNPAIDWPLALCDYRSVDPAKDTYPVTLVYPDREGETLGVAYNPNHKWKYFHGVTPEECILIKCFDSVQDGSVAIFTPHTGFEDPATPEGTPYRESIEMRALVFYD